MLLIFIKITLKHSVVSAVIQVGISLNELSWSFYPVNFTCAQLESRHFGDTTSFMGSAFITPCNRSMALNFDVSPPPRWQEMTFVLHASHCNVLLLEYWPDSYQNYSAGNLEVDYQEVAKIAKFRQ